MNGSKIITANNEYKKWIADVKRLIKSTQIKASIAVNEEMLELYWSIGHDISEKQLDSKYGSKFFETLSAEIRKDFPDTQGFSERNLRYMKQFYIFYKDILHQLGAEFESRIFTIPWRHHIEIFTRSKSTEEALFFIEKLSRMVGAVQCSSI